MREATIAAKDVKAGQTVTRIVAQEHTWWRGRGVQRDQDIRQTNGQSSGLIAWQCELHEFCGTSCWGDSDMAPRAACEEHPFSGWVPAREAAP